MENNQIDKAVEMQVSTQDSSLCLSKQQKDKCAAIQKINLLRSFPVTKEEVEDAMFTIEVLFEDCSPKEIFEAIKDLAIGKRKYNSNEGFRSLFMAIDINRNGNTYYED